MFSLLQTKKTKENEWGMEMSQCKVNVKCRNEWIAVTEYTRIHCRLPIKVRKTMFLISGLNIFFSFYPLVVFTSTIALSPVFVLIVCWITLRGKLRRQFTITNLHYFGDKRKSFTVFSLLFFQCAGGAFVEECRFCVQTYEVALLSGIFDHISCVPDKKCNMKWLFSHPISIFMSHCFIWNEHNKVVELNSWSNYVIADTLKLINELYEWQWSAKDH